MYQTTMILGRLGADPIMRYTSTGAPVTTFSVAVNRRLHLEQGGTKDEVLWFRVTAWNKRAETINQYTRKGDLVYIIGVLTEPEAYQGKDGKWHASLEMTANDVRFIPNGKRDKDNPTQAELDRQDEESALEGYPGW